MARRELVGEAVVKLTADARGFMSELAAARAEAEAMLAGLEDRKTIPVDIDIDISSAKAALLSLDEQISDIKDTRDKFKEGGKAWKRETEAIRELKKVRAELNTEIKRATTFKQLIAASTRKLTAAEREEAKAAKEVADAVRETNKAWDEYEDTQKRVSKEVRKTWATHEKAQDDHVESVNKSAQSEVAAFEAAQEKMNYLHGVALEENKKFNKRQERERLRMERERQRGEVSDSNGSRMWKIITNSRSPMETMAKLSREPVKLGPFTGTPKGIATGMSAFGPVLASISGGALAAAGSIGGALTFAFSGATAAALGFGQGLIGISAVIAPMANEFKLASQVTEAYAKAVSKYGEGSKQAKKAQEQMNSVLKQMSPTARRAYTDLAEVQKTFKEMTKSARPGMERALAAGMGTFRSLAPGFARNTVTASNNLSTGLQEMFGRLRSEEKGGKGFLSTTFRNANAAIIPLLRGVTSLTFALGEMGASASRFLKPMSEGFANMMQRFLNWTQRPGMNKTMDSLKADWDSVSGAIKSASSWLVHFLDAGRGSGRGLFDSLSATFKRWDEFAKSDAGRAELKNFFDEAANGLRTIGRVLSTMGKMVSTFTKVFAPVFSAIARYLISPIANAVHKMLEFKEVVLGLQMVIGGLLLNSIFMKMGSAIGFVIGRVKALRAAIISVGVASQAASMYGGTLFGAPAAARGAKAGAGAVKTGEQALYGSLRNNLASGAATGGVMGAIGKFGRSPIGKGAKILPGPLKLVAGLAGISFVLGEIAKSGNGIDKVVESVGKLKKNLPGALTEWQASFDSAKSAAQSFKDAAAAYKADPNSQNLYNKNVAKSNLIRSNADLANQRKAVLTPFSQAEANAIRERDAYLKRIGVNKNQLSADGTLAIPKDATDREAAQIEKINSRLRELYETQRKVANMRAGLETAFNARANLGMSNDLPGADKMFEQLGALQNRVGGAMGKSLALKIGTIDADPAVVRRVASTVTRALNANIKPKDIKAAIDPTSADRTLRNLINLIRRKERKPVEIKPTGVSAFTNTVSGLTRPGEKRINITPIVNGKFKPGGSWGLLTGQAEGGIVAGASGFTKRTAFGSAGRRPMRRAMGKFNEPTFLVGEENRSEYVIATNPAYRRQNEQYLAQAASEFGMAVIPAASGYANAGRIRRAIFSDTDIANEIKRAKKRAGTLAKRIQNIRDGGVTKSERPKLTRAKAELDRLNKRLKSGDLATSKPAIVRTGRKLEMWQDTADALSRQMDVAEKRGDSKTFEALRKKRDGVLRNLKDAYSKALPGASGNARAKLLGSIAGFENDIIDNRGRSIGGSAGELSAARISQLEAQLSSERSARLISEAYSSVAGGMFNQGIIAGGGPNAPSTANGYSIVINTLHPGDSETYAAIAKAANQGNSNQGAVIASSASVGV